MQSRNPLEIKRMILSLLSKDKAMTYAQLEKKTNGNWRTIRNQCNELEIFDCVEIVEMKSHKLNNKPYTEIRITKRGFDVLKKISLKR